MLFNFVVSVIHAWRQACSSGGEYWYVQTYLKEDDITLGQLKWSGGWRGSWQINSWNTLSLLYAWKEIEALPLVMVFKRAVETIYISPLWFYVVWLWPNDVIEERYMLISIVIVCLLILWNDLLSQICWLHRL